jgi:hypothetical protein
MKSSGGGGRRCVDASLVAVSSLAWPIFSIPFRQVAARESQILRASLVLKKVNTRNIWLPRTSRAQRQIHSTLASYLTADS